MRSSEKQELKKKIQRVGWFMLIVFVPMLVVAACMAVYVKEQWITIIVLVVLMMILFFLYAYLMGKLDERKKKRMDKKRDPFSD